MKNYSDTDNIPAAYVRWSREKPEMVRAVEGLSPKDLPFYVSGVLTLLKIEDDFMDIGLIGDGAWIVKKENAGTFNAVQCFQRLMSLLQEMNEEDYRSLRSHIHSPGFRLAFWWPYREKIKTSYLFIGDKSELRFLSEDEAAETASILQKTGLHILYGRNGSFWDLTEWPGGDRYVLDYDEYDYGSVDDAATKIRPFLKKLDDSESE